jgi:acyl-CoA reductase-like NAD-dependent aldehyde dehydrogenase
VHESIYAQFLDAMVCHTQTLKVGSSITDEDVKLGPVQNEMQYLKVKEYFDDCAKEGHKFATGGKVDPGKGYFITPTIVDNPPAVSRIVTEEPFGG